MTQINISLSNAGTLKLAQNIVADWPCSDTLKEDCAVLVVRYIDSLYPPFKLLNLRKVLDTNKHTIIQSVSSTRKLIDEGLHRFPEE
jgi:hypothetical protein